MVVCCVCRSYPKYVALERALEKEGLPLVILIRIAPYPYPIFNALFAATRVEFHIFAIGTAISLIKVKKHIHAHTASVWLIYLLLRRASRS